MTPIGSNHILRLLFSLALVHIFQSCDAKPFTADSTSVSNGTTLPESYLASLTQCNNEQLLYWRSRSVWSNDHGTIITTNITSTDILTAASIITLALSVPTITLCDGVARAGQSTTTSQTIETSVFSFSTPVSTANPEFAGPSPACSINTDDCVALSSYATAHSTEFPTNSNGRADIPCTTSPCFNCMIFARSVKLYHWPITPTIPCRNTTTGLEGSYDLAASMPTSTLSSPITPLPTGSTTPGPAQALPYHLLPPPPITVVSAGLTFTSPSLYLSFHDISALDYAQSSAYTCGAAPSPTAPFISLDPAALSSIRYGPSPPAPFPLDPADFAHTTTLGARVPLVPRDAYRAQYRCWGPRPSLGPVSPECEVVRDDYVAEVAWAGAVETQARGLDDAWSRCGVFDNNGLLVVDAEEIGEGEGLGYGSRVESIPWDEEDGRDEKHGEA